MALRRRTPNAALRADRLTRWPRGARGRRVHRPSPSSSSAASGGAAARRCRPRRIRRRLLAARGAASETAEVARVGYREVSTRENAMFNLLSSFVGAFVAARGIALAAAVAAERRAVPQRDARAAPHPPLRAGHRAGFVSGAAAIVTRDERLEPWLAIPFGAGMGLTLDESALLLELDDVYWSRGGDRGRADLARRRLDARRRWPWPRASCAAARRSCSTHRRKATRRRGSGRRRPARSVRPRRARLRARRRSATRTAGRAPDVLPRRPCRRHRPFPSPWRP